MYLLNNDSPVRGVIFSPNSCLRKSRTVSFSSSCLFLSWFLKTTVEKFPSFARAAVERAPVGVACISGKYGWCLLIARAQEAARARNVCVTSWFVNVPSARAIWCMLFVFSASALLLHSYLFVLQMHTGFWPKGTFALMEKEDCLCRSLLQCLFPTIIFTYVIRCLLTWSYMDTKTSSVRPVIYRRISLLLYMVFLLRFEMWYGAILS